MRRVTGRTRGRAAPPPPTAGPALEPSEIITPARPWDELSASERAAKTARAERILSALSALLAAWKGDSWAITDPEREAAAEPTAAVLHKYCPAADKYGVEADFLGCVAAFYMARVNAPALAVDPKDTKKPADGGDVPPPPPPAPAAKGSDDPFVAAGLKA